MFWPDNNTWQVNVIIFPSERHKSLKHQSAPLERFDPIGFYPFTKKLSSEDFSKLYFSSYWRKHCIIVIIWGPMSDRRHLALAMSDEGVLAFFVRNWSNSRGHSRSPTAFQPPLFHIFSEIIFLHIWFVFIWSVYAFLVPIWYCVQKSGLF